MEHQTKVTSLHEPETPNKLHNGQKLENTPPVSLASPRPKPKQPGCLLEQPPTASAQAPLCPSSSRVPKGHNGSPLRLSPPAQEPPKKPLSSKVPKAPGPVPPCPLSVFLIPCLQRLKGSHQDPLPQVKLPPAEEQQGPLDVPREARDRVGSPERAAQLRASFWGWTPKRNTKKGNPKGFPSLSWLFRGGQRTADQLSGGL